MKKYLEYKDDKSQKFWKIEVSNTEFNVTYGKIGTDGRIQNKTFESNEKALLEANKLVAQKLKKGYVEVNNDEDLTEEVTTKHPFIPTSKMDPEIEKESLEHIQQEVEFGFYHKKDIYQIIKNTFYDVENYDKKWLKKEIKKQFNAHLEKSAQWQKPTDFDRLLNAFDQLNQEKIVAMHKIGNTKQEAIEECTDLAKKLLKKEITTKGYCYYHTQDLQRAIGDTKNLLIGFDSTNHNNEQALEVGKKIVEILQQNNFKVKWNNTLEQRIEIIEINWQKTPDVIDYNSRRIIQIMTGKLIVPNEKINYYEALKKFDDEYGGESYVDCFFMVDDEDDFFEHWLPDCTPEEIKSYSTSIKVFAGADGTGARYAFWLKNGNTDYNNAPIICYGSEGQIDIIADNIKDLLVILSFGQESMDGNFYFDMYDIEDYETEDEFFQEYLENYPNFKAFRKWMKTDLGIEPVKKWKVNDNSQVNKLVNKAVKIHQKSFDKWQYKFYPDPKEGEKKYYEAQDIKYHTNKIVLLSKLKSNPSPSLYLLLAENEEIVEKIDFEQRKQFLLDGHEAFPQNLEIILKIGEENEVSDSALSVSFYEKVLQIDPKNKNILSKIAYAHMMLETDEHKEKAIEYYIKDIKENPESYGEYSQGYIVDLCDDLKRKDAIAILEDSLTTGPNAGTYKVLFKQYYKKKNYKKAAENAILYIENSDEQAHNYTELSTKLVKKEAYLEAIPVIEKLLPRHTWDDSKMRSYNNLGLCYLRTQQIDRAIYTFKKGYWLDKEEPAFHENIHLCGNYFLQATEYSKAIAVFEFCIEEKISTAFTFNSLGVCYSKQKKQKKALEYFEMALIIDPENKQFIKNIEFIKTQLNKL